MEKDEQHCHCCPLEEAVRSVNTSDAWENTGEDWEGKSLCELRNLQAKWQRPESHLGINGFSETQSRMFVVLARPAHISPCLAGVSNGKASGTVTAAKCAALAFATSNLWQGRSE